MREPSIRAHHTRADRGGLVKLDKLSLLSQAPLFAGIDPGALTELSQRAGTRKLDADQALVHKGDPGGELYGVLRGRLRVRGLAPDGRTMVYSYMDPGAIFGEISVVDQQPRSAGVDAAEASEVLVVHRSHFAAFVRQHPQVAINLARMLAARLARRILALGETYGKPAGEGTQISIRLPQHELGELVGATRESVNKLLRRWSEQGIISVEQGTLTVLDPAALRDVADMLVD